MRIDERLNRRFELRHAAKDAAPELLSRQQGEPAFDETQPRRIGGGEVHVERGRLANQFRISGVLWVP